jgi:phosphopantothenoylcysteine decarboxylase
MNILLGVTGSVAAKLNPKLEMALVDAGYVVKTVLTESAKRFTYSTQTSYDDEDEWRYYNENSTVLHIDLVKWADVFVIAPCTANTLSKIEVGICDNLLTCCVRAWPHKDKRNIILAPAMNTCMWDKTHVHRQYDNLCLRGDYSWIPPVEKTLFCGDTGIGAMADIDTIVERIK